MSYERFREDFINSRTFLCEQDRDIMNDHQVNLGRIASFLSVRKDLVRKFSSREADLSAFHTCMREFMLGSLRSEAKADIVNFECFLSDRTLSIIADAANDIPLFRQRVSSDDMGKLFNECLFLLAVELFRCDQCQVPARNRLQQVDQEFTGNELYDSGGSCIGLVTILFCRPSSQNEN